MNRNLLTRRSLLKGMGALTAGGALGASQLISGRAAHAQATRDRRFLIVLGASGGASMIDSFLAIRASESANAQTINTYPDAEVLSFEDTPFRAIDRQRGAVGAIPAPYSARQSDFVRKHHDNMLVLTCTGTSVNHRVAQRRSITGNEAWAGRTMQEAVALQYGLDLPLPNVAMATGTSFIEAGSDRSLPSQCFGENVASPALWPLSLDGSRGLRAADRRWIEMARRTRDDKLDPESAFAKVFENSAALEHYRSQRAGIPRLEMSDLITKLMLFEDSPSHPLTAHGLVESPSGRQVRERFGRFAEDPLEAQAALAFLLLKHRVSASVTIGPSFNAVLADGASLGGGGLNEGDLINPPIAFDFSHQDHRDTQALMWSRILGVADGLIDLLSSEEYADGESFWDRTLIYIATDFGRDKIRPANAEDFGTSHHLNNGFLVISPLVAGNRILGGVDPDTGLTYGVDPTTLAPDPGRTTSEAQVYAGVLGALGIDTSGSDLPNVDLT